MSNQVFETPREVWNSYIPDNTAIRIRKVRKEDVWIFSCLHRKNLSGVKAVYVPRENGFFSVADGDLVCRTDEDGSTSLLFCLGRNRNVLIPEGVTSIADGAFYGTGVRFVSLPKTVKMIGSMAFEGCTELETVLFPEGLESIGSRAFRGARFRTLILPDSLESIDEEAFMDCRGLESVSFSPNLKKIGDKAFQNTPLKAVHFPASLEKIGIAAYRGCTELASAYFEDCKNLEVGNFAFYGCKSLERLRLPDGLSRLGNMTFAGQNSLEAVTLPDTLKSIGQCCFPEVHKLYAGRIIPGMVEAGEMDTGDDQFFCISISGHETLVPRDMTEKSRKKVYRVLEESVQGNGTGIRDMRNLTYRNRFRPFFERFTKAC